MNHLIEPTTTVTDKFIFKLDFGEDAKGQYEFCVIVFEDKKFSHCSFPFIGRYTRKQWNVLAQITAEIARIEKEFEYQSRQRPAETEAAGILLALLPFVVIREGLSHDENSKAQRVLRSANEVKEKLWKP
jgi:hypothetical protein